MSTNDDYQPLLGLTPDEINVDCLIRGIDTSDVGYKNVLREALKEEYLNPSRAPDRSHADNFQIELEACKTQISSLTAILNKKQDAFPRLTEIANQIRHWRGRLQRLKGCFYQDNEVDQALNHFRRLNKLLESHREEYAHEQQISIPISTISTSTSVAKPSIFSIETPTITLGLGGHEQLPKSKNVYANVPATTFSAAELGPSMSTQQMITTWTHNPMVTRCSPIVGPSFTTHYQNPPGNPHIYLSPNIPVNNPNQSNPQVKATAQSNINPYYHYEAQHLGTNVNNAYIEQDRIHHNISRPVSHYAKNDPKWKISFSGLPDGLDVHDFLFRIESLASKENISLNRLESFMPKLLTHNAEKWYWVFVRKSPQATYFSLRQALLDRFSTTESDRALRRSIQNKKQGERETIGDYILEMESLNGRLVRPFSENELVEIIRDNMGVTYREVTLSTPSFTADSLRVVCEQYEKLWVQKRKQAAFSGRNPKYVHEIIRDGDPIYSNELVSNGSTAETLQQLCRNECYVDSIQKGRPTFNDKSRETPQLICWNCHDLGHRYQDCTLPPQGIFCYGCGKRNIIKPQCPQCTNKWPGNLYPGVSRSGSTRPVQLISRPIQTERASTPQTEESASNTEPFGRR